MTELEKRKKLLIAESEVYRQTLKLELQNLRIYGMKTKDRLMSFRAGNPVFMVGIPLLMSLLGRRKRGRVRRAGAWGFLGWQFLRRVSDLFPSRRAAADGDETVAAEEYLNRRM